VSFGITDPATPGLELAAHNQSMLFSGIVSSHPDQCLQIFLIVSDEIGAML
jgi:hypothetical protein